MYRPDRDKLRVTERPDVPRLNTVFVRELIVQAVKDGPLLV